MSDAHDRTQQILNDHLEPIAAFARESYEVAGRGCIFVTFPDVPPGHTAIGVNEMVYHTLAAVPAIDEDAAVLVRMIADVRPNAAMCGARGNQRALADLPQVPVGPACGARRADGGAVMATKHTSKGVPLPPWPAMARR